MANKAISKLNLVPQITPQFRLWSSRLADKIASDLDVAPEDNGPVWGFSFGNGYKARHLWVINDQYVGATFRGWTKRTIDAVPVSFAILLNPILQ